MGARSSGGLVEVGVPVAAELAVQDALTADKADDVRLAVGGLAVDGLAVDGDRCGCGVDDILLPYTECDSRTPPKLRDDSRYGDAESAGADGRM
jgi:hypothetical protein